jgi:crotonobetainyl-CoA:carnitine CoA-transferase CaiB-like acyl-CoA transferase
VQPLRGILFVAVEQAVAAPICTRHLGVLGARVVKVENCAGGDFARDYDDVVRGMSAYFAWANRNKESIALDLKHPLGRGALMSLVQRADVLVQNLAPGAAARLGLDAAELRASRPELITVDISGFGQGGPYAQGRAYDLLIQSEAGSCAITGTPRAPGQARYSAGRHRWRDVCAVGRSGRVVRPRAHRHGDGDLCWAVRRGGGMDGICAKPCSLRRVGHRAQWRQPAVAPYGAYRTADGQTLVLGTTNDREWRRLAVEVLHRPDLAEDPRYARNRDRVAHRAELDEVIGVWAAGLSLAECRKAAEAAGLGHARLNRPTEVLSHPRLDPIPALGEHTEPVLRELGFSAADLAAMRAAGVISEATATDCGS